MTSRKRQTTTAGAVLVWVLAALAQSSVPGLHALGTGDIGCGAERIAAAVAHAVSPGGDAAQLVAHAPGHPHHDGTHDPAGCAVCRTLQHTAGALTPAVAAVLVPPGVYASSVIGVVAAPRDGTRGGHSPRAPPALA